MRIGPCKGSLINGISPKRKVFFYSFSSKSHDVFQCYGRNWFSQICSHYLLSNHNFHQQSLMIDSFQENFCRPRLPRIDNGCNFHWEPNLLLSNFFLLHFFDQGLKGHFYACENSFNCPKNRSNPRKWNHICSEANNIIILRIVLITGLDLFRSKCLVFSSQEVYRKVANSRLLVRYIKTYESTWLSSASVGSSQGCKSSFFFSKSNLLFSKTTSCISLLKVWISCYSPCD